MSTPPWEQLSVRQTTGTEHLQPTNHPWHSSSSSFFPPLNTNQNQTQTVEWTSGRSTCKRAAQAAFMATNPMKTKPDWVEPTGNKNVCLQIAYILVIFLTISLFSSVQLNGSDGGKKEIKRNLYFLDLNFYLPNLKGRNFVPWQMVRWGRRLPTALTFSGFRESFLFLWSIFLPGSSDVSIPAFGFLKSVTPMAHVSSPPPFVTLQSNH